MPSLNVRDYIEEALNSVCNQSLKDIEIICIDAGSTDGTWDIIRKASVEDNRIRTYQSEVKSYGYQVNLGIEMAQGEYVAILETDDFVSLDMYGTLYKAAKRWDVDYIKCDYYAYFNDKCGERRYIERIISTNESLYNKPFCPRDYPRNVIDDWYLWNGIYKKSFLKENAISLSNTPGAAFQDIGFLHQVSVSAKRIIYIKNKLYYYCIDREGASSKSNKTLKYIRQEYGRIMEETKELDDDIIKRMIFARMARSYVRACMDSSDEVFVEEETIDICEWFRRALLTGEEKKLLNNANLPYSMRDGYNALLSSTEEYLANRKRKKTLLIDFLGKGNPIVIFGCGLYGKEAFIELSSNRYVVNAFMDNNHNLWGEEIEGVKVISPDEIPNLSINTRIVIANEKYSNEIRNQIIDYRRDIQTYIYV